MNKYTVTIVFTGSITYSVDAADENAVEETALDRLSAEPAASIVDSLGQPVVSIEQED